MRAPAIAALLATALTVAACATYDDDYGYRHRGRYGGYDYLGEDYQRLGNDCDAFGGRGGEMLDPWLACTEEGQELVHYRFDRDGDGRIGAETADEANVWFRRHADTNRDLCLTDPEIKAALVNSARFLARRY